jgi:hypothetical protein
LLVYHAPSVWLDEEKCCRLHFESRNCLTTGNRFLMRRGHPAIGDRQHHAATTFEASEVPDTQAIQNRTYRVLSIGSCAAGPRRLRLVCDLCGQGATTYRR